MGDPVPKKDNQPGDYIILDDTDSDPDSDDDYVDEAGADIMESSSDENFQTTTIVISSISLQVVATIELVVIGQTALCNLVCY